MSFTSSELVHRTVDDVRRIMKSFCRKTIVVTKHPIEFNTCMNLISHHPNWQNKLETVEAFKVVPNKLNKTALCLQVKLIYCRYFTTISWKKCLFYCNKQKRIDQIKNKATDAEKKKGRIRTSGHETKDHETEDHAMKDNTEEDNTKKDDTKSNEGVNATTNNILRSNMISSAELSMFESACTSETKCMVDQGVAIDERLHLQNQHIVETSVGANNEKKVDSSNTPIPSNIDKIQEEKQAQQNAHKSLTGAMRFAVRRQISGFRKDNTFHKQCAQCGNLLHLHVDHKETPFVTLQANFFEQCRLKNIPVPTVFAYHRSTCQAKFHKRDVGFNRRWQNYHKKHAKLQWLCQKCNLTKGCK